MASSLRTWCICLLVVVLVVLAAHCINRRLTGMSASVAESIIQWVLIIVLMIGAGSIARRRRKP